jgi:hypothetical protein
MSENTIFVLVPHTDDGESGCGASIAMKIRNGYSVVYAAFSICSRLLPQGWGALTLNNGDRIAARTLGLPLENLMLFNYEVRRVKGFRLLSEILLKALSWSVVKKLTDK